MANLLEAPAPRAEKVRAPRSWRASRGLVPFALYLLVFLGGPLYFVISGALSGSGRSAHAGEPVATRHAAAVPRRVLVAA